MSKEMYSMKECKQTTNIGEQQFYLTIHTIANKSKQILDSVEFF